MKNLAVSRTKVYAIQNTEVEPPGLISEVLEARGISVEPIRAFEGNRIPRRIGDHAGLVVMGGPMGVYEHDQRPFLRQEIRLLQDALREGRPILGVCLGSQLLAVALDAAVTRGMQKEIGWHPVTLSHNAAQDALWHDLPESMVAYHWHGDVFELPRKATSLAWSKLTDCQAFRYGDSAYGLLFHLEVTETIIRRMTRLFRRELRGAGLSERAVRDGVPEHLPRLQIIGRTVFERWAALVAGEASQPTSGCAIRAKRVCEPAAAEDGARFLVDRLWPRGVRKEALRFDEWQKDIAPSDSLRRWFGHDPARWTEFRRRYFSELDEHPAALQPIREAAARGPVTLLYGASDTANNNAVALIEYLENRSPRRGRRRNS